eukprot:gene138-221_t
MTTEFKSWRDTANGFIYLIRFCRGQLKVSGDTVKTSDCTSKNDVLTCCSSIIAGRNLSVHLNRHHIGGSKCIATKVYIQSPYEEDQFNAASRYENSRAAVIEFLLREDEIMASKTWLERVNLRMNTIDDIEETEADRKYLSYFMATRTCGNDVKTWKEWIEPISFHTRHPYSYFGLLLPTDNVPNRNSLPKADICDVSYILLNSAKNHHRMVHQTRSRTIILDAGCANSFTSSSQWFSCAYSQLGFKVDRVFSWELTIQEPVKWWNTVPAEFRSKVHFYNIPVNAQPDHPDNPLDVIRHVATESDFVAFKLDIDYRDTEIAMTLQLLNDPSLLALVDEFFFEFHHSCPITKRVEEPFMGLTMDRLSAMTLFKDLRMKGIRAHIWP